VLQCNFKFEYVLQCDFNLTYVLQCVYAYFLCYGRCQLECQNISQRKCQIKCQNIIVFLYIKLLLFFLSLGDMANMEQISYMCMLTWNCWLSTKWQLVGLYVNINMTSSQKVPGIKIHQHIPTPTWNPFFV
jgi:hypothetical protein